MARTKTADRLRNAETAVDKMALRIVKAVVAKPGITRQQLRFAFDTRPGELAPAFKAAGSLLKYASVEGEHTRAVTPTDDAIALVHALGAAPRRAPKSANAAATATARKAASK